MFIFLSLVCPRWVDPSQCRSEKGEESSGRKASCPDPGFQTTPSVEEISPARQDNLPQARVTDSSSRNAGQLFIRTHNETLSVVPSKKE